MYLLATDVAECWNLSEFANAEIENFGFPRLAVFDFYSPYEIEKINKHRSKIAKETKDLFYRKNVCFGYKRQQGNLFVDMGIVDEFNTGEPTVIGWKSKTSAPELVSSGLKNFDKKVQSWYKKEEKPVEIKSEEDPGEQEKGKIVKVTGNNFNDIVLPVSI